MIIVLTFIVIFSASMMHGISGFGFAQISMGLLPLFRDPFLATVLVTINSAFCNCSVFWSVKEDFNVKDWIVPVGGLLFGMPIGIYIFQSLSNWLMRLSIGIILLISIILILLMQELDLVKDRLKEKSIEPGWKSGVTAGFVAGILGGALAISGPPIIIWGAFMVANEYWEGSRMKAVFTAFFGSLMIYRMIFLVYTDSLTISLLGQSFIAIPFLFIGVWVGINIFSRVTKKVFGWLVLLGLMVNAFILIITSF